VPWDWPGPDLRRTDHAYCRKHRADGMTRRLECSRLLQKPEAPRAHLEHRIVHQRSKVDARPARFSLAAHSALQNRAENAPAATYATTVSIPRAVACPPE